MDRDPNIWGPEPRYASWVSASEAADALAADNNQTLSIFFADLNYWGSTLSAEEDGEEEDEQNEDGNEDESPAEPMLAVPGFAGVGFLLTFWFAEFNYPFVGDIKVGTGETDEQPEDPVAEIDEGVNISNSIILWGDIDTDAVADRADGFEPVEHRGRFELFGEVSDDGSAGDSAFAVAEDVLVLMTQDEDKNVEEKRNEATMLAPLQDRLDAGHGDTERAIDVNEQFERFVRSTQPGISLFGNFGASSLQEDEEDSDESADNDPEDNGSEDDDDFEEFEAAMQEIGTLGGGKIGVFGSVDIEEENHGTAEMTLGYEDEDGLPTEAAIKDMLGVGANSRTVTMEDKFVHVSAEWIEDAEGENSSFSRPKYVSGREGTTVQSLSR